MIVNSINITRSTYGPDEGQYVTRVRIDGAYGSTELRLSEELSYRVIEVVSGEIVKSSKAIADSLSREALVMTTTAIEHQPSD
jgi:hypothetical protein